MYHPLRTISPPFSRPLSVAPAHAERISAALGSPKAKVNVNAPCGTISAARPRGQSGETTAHHDLLRGCLQNSVQ